MTRLQHSADKQGKHFWSPGECHYGDVPKRSGGQGAWNELYAQTSQTILSRTHTHLYLHRCQLLLCTFKPHHLLKKCLHLKQNMPYNSNISDCQKEWPISDLSAKQHDVHEYTEVRKIPSASPRLFKKKSLGLNHHSGISCNKDLNELYDVCKQSAQRFPASLVIGCLIFYGCNKSKQLNRCPHDSVFPQNCTQSCFILFMNTIRMKWPFMGSGKIISRRELNYRFISITSAVFLHCSPNLDVNTN